jgi:hypothetical protein
MSYLFHRHRHQHQFEEQMASCGLCWAWRWLSSLPLLSGYCEGGEVIVLRPIRKVMPTSFSRFYAMKNRLIMLTMGAVILFGCQAKVHGDAVCNPPVDNVEVTITPPTTPYMCVGDTKNVALSWDCSSGCNTLCKQTVVSSGTNVLLITSTPTTWNICHHGSATVTVKGIGPGKAILTLSFWGYDGTHTPPREWVLQWTTVEITVLKVEITEPNENPVTDNNFTFDSASPGVCNVPATGTCGVPSENPNLEWTLTGIAGSTQTSSPDPAKGSTITNTYTTLPSANAQFGAKTLTLTHPASGCQDTQTVQIFFTEEANNNPGGTNPNWYYYWKQTPANYGTHSWEPGSGSGQTRFDGGQWKAFLRNANESAGAGTWNNAEGIDFFAHMCRHEEQHRLDNIALWGASSDRVATNDVDKDYLPDNQEATLVPGHPYTNTLYGTYPDTFNYGGDPLHLRDCEDYCLRRQASWTNGSADTNDWANPGHQSSQ